IFDNNLLASYNYYNLKPSKGSSLRHPFGQLQKKCEQCLVIMDKVSKECKLVLLSDRDMSFFQDALIKTKSDSHSESQIDVCLYDFNLGVLGQEETIKRELEKNPNFQ